MFTKDSLKQTLILFIIFKEEQNRRATQCRHDFMQTGTHVIVNVYCKQYDPLDEELTYVEVNPIRLRIRVFFPSSGASYSNDLELRGVS